MINKKKLSDDLTPPVVCYFNRLKALLDNDEDVTMSLDYKKSIITISINNAPKAAAWHQILGDSITFGDTTVQIIVESTQDDIDENVIITALTGNKAFSRFVDVQIPKSKVVRHFCYMNPMIVQFFNDNFGSPESLETRLVEDLAREILDIPTLNFCTEPIINEDEEE